jgi:hypothetical protein
MDKQHKIFNQINASMLKFDPSLGASIYCPVCWHKFAPNDIESKLSLEHVPSTSASKLIKEKSLFTLTCKNCNNSYGTKYQNDLKHFLIHQLWERGKFDGQIPIEVSIEGSSPLICNLIWNPIDINKKIEIIGVPKANNPLIIKEHQKLLEKYVETQVQDWKIEFNGNLGYKRINIWTAYIHLAYLVACIRSEYMYAFSEAGKLIRQLLAENIDSQFGWPIIPSQVVDAESWLWLAIVNKPKELSCAWIKVAWNIVILPNPETKDVLTLYKNWREISKDTSFGISPDAILFNLSFLTNQDLNEAKKSLPKFFGRIDAKE